jgi:hypothetical protein
MSAKMIAMVASVLVLLSLSSVSFAAESPDSTPTRTGSARTAPPVPLPQEISTALETLLKMVDEGKTPNKEEVAAVDYLLQQNKKNVTRYDEPGKTKYFMLSAWDNYFAGKADAAVQSLQAGIKSGPDDPDMKATYAAIAIAAEKYPMLGKLAAPKAPATTKKKKKGTEEDSGQMGGTSTATASGVLSFDAQALRPQAINRKIAVTGSTFDCIGGITVAAGRSDLLCMLVYRSVSAAKDKTATSQSEDMQARQESEDKSKGGFGALALDYVGNDKVSFIGVSLDDVAAEYNSMKAVSENGWFWPQVMAMKASNKPLNELAKYEIDRPTMAIVSKDGTIIYMGSPSGFLPKMLLAKATNNYAPKLFVPAKPLNLSDPNARKMRMNDPNNRRTRAGDPNGRRAKVTDANAVTSGDDKSDDAFQMGSDLKAEELYNHAKSFLKGSRTTTLTAGSGVQLCRQILQQYANTEYAAKARELLRELPDELKTRYNITSAEMGI